MEKFLTDDERVELRKKYYADNLREAPANIKDETLIKNYGDDEQKKRLEASEAGNGEEPKGETNEAGTENGAGDNSGDGAENGELKPSDSSESKEFAYQFNEYVRLHGSAPDASIKTADELRALNLSKENELNVEVSEDAEPVVNAKGMKTITLVNKETGAKINPTVYTYENFIKKTQPEWVPLASVKPKEIQ